MVVITGELSNSETEQGLKRRPGWLEKVLAKAFDGKIHQLVQRIAILTLWQDFKA